MNKTLTAIKKSAPVNSIRKLFQDYSSIFAILLMGAIFTIASPYFLTKTNINNILLQSSALAIAAIGQAMIVISGNLDLSLGQCVCFSSVVSAYLMKFMDVNPLVAIIAALLVGCLVGLVNGTLVAYVGLPAFIATLGMQMVLYSFSRIITDAVPIARLPKSIAFLGRGYIGAIPICVIIMIILYIVMHFISIKTKFGRNVFAIGGGSEAAYDVEGILPAIDKCQEAGIPVIAIDTAIDHPWVSTCIAWDNYETGKVLGEYAANYIETNLSDKETVNIIMLDGTGYPHLEKRDQGFLESLSRLDNVEIIARQCTNGNRELSANVVSNNLTKGVDLIYGVVDNHAWGAVTALEEAQVENCAVICCGGFGEEPFEALEADHPYYKALFVVPPVNIVTSALDAVEKVLAGETVESTINIEFGLADHDTVGNYR